MQKFVEMKAVTWQKDSHGLFDYETQLLNVEKHTIKQEQKVYRSGQAVSTITPDAEQVNTTQLLTQIIEQNSSFYIDPCGNDENENFLIVRSLKNSQGSQKGYKLEPGNIIRLGRMEYMIIETKDKDNAVALANDDVLQDWFEINTEFDSNLQAQCKFCLFETQSVEDPFISPCNCKGSCQYIHFSCLRQWIESRCQVKQQSGTLSYRWKQLHCEICESQLPQKINIGTRGYSLDVIQRPTQPYLIMQATCKDKKQKKQQSKAIHVLQFDNNDPIKIGRGHLCDIRISDISVSRLHAFIKYEDGNFVILDNNSKFGTLVKLLKPFKLEQEKVAIQVGRSVLTFAIKQSIRTIE